MTRPHIDFLQSQALPWKPSPWPFLPGCQLKTLSRDADTGALSLLVRYPSGWAAPAPGPLGTTEELFVLEGMLELDGRRYGQDCYGWFPPGWRHAVRATADGAVALVFLGAEPVSREAAATTARRAVEGVLIDAFALAWVAAGPGAGFGAAAHRSKSLHVAPDGGPATTLITLPAHLHPPDWRAPQEIHGCAEEVFLLSGDLVSPAGAMTAGAYCSRPAAVTQGPYASRGGGLALVRTHGTPQSTEHSAHELELERAPQYQPVLPPALRTRGGGSQ